MSRRSEFLEALGIGTEWVPRQARDAQADTGVPDSASVATTDATALVESAPKPANASGPELEVTVAQPALQSGLADESAEFTDAFARTDLPGPGNAASIEAVPATVGVPADVGGQTGLAAPDRDARPVRVSICTANERYTAGTKGGSAAGDQRAAWLLVGEGPAESEDKQGEPFFGQSGRLLDNMLGAAGMARDDEVSIAQILDGRPGATPHAELAAAGQRELDLSEHVTLRRPRLIVVLGSTAAQSLLRTTTQIGKLRGVEHVYEGIPVVVTYHPAYLLRTLTDKARAWEDLCLARKIHEREANRA